MSRRLRRTKIVCTMGPSTDRGNNLEKIIAAGANVVRMNFSHGTPEDHIGRAQRVREIAQKLGKTVAILGDLQGPKIRVSTFKDGKIFLNVGEKFILDAELPKGEGTQESVGLDYKTLPQDVVPGDILLLDDGRVQLKVLSTEGAKVFTEVTVGGPLSNNKGINKLGGGLSADALTEKDKADIITAARIGVDYLAVSFPRSGEDLHYARKLAEEAGLKAKIVAKVERAEAVATDEAMDDIILASDVIMVARGDLGVEIGDPELVGVQKKLIRRSRQLNRVVITATQMMESMISNPMPTRAEVMDVANAVLDGTDAVMLSAETAAGQYPSETVAAMAKVCLGAEKMPSVNVSRHRVDRTFDTIEEAVAMSAMFAANHMKGVAAIIAMTNSGHTAKLMSRISSGLPIFALSRHQETLNLCALYRGVIPVHFDQESRTIEGLKSAIQLLKDKGYLVTGDLVLLTQGDLLTSGGTNTCRTLVVE
ncbi:pyruvate kinase [Avibacterium paragallinarum]|uniref:Pyruvate kinase n=1 Tax=Avibacterium paragallinarum TaxID=728 RepID=A0AAE5WGQ1_AVIPA|nr:pyruvate kinase [Avibacterium paragallinarum]MEE3608731.1 pyruvate kinase [Avibacterium paragallinarum]MEE3622097.1 pyruvate kinase [Avibacterium paragallinarum]MEE3668646.1 pyruvate kinase [Avibacterium paragallinarum]MEE3681082.1 pyruvate kinase [Avibacterium paragallinarum]MEE4385764.1 pyruvate kinase [Avibacterium paragallinarum]